MSLKEIVIPAIKGKMGDWIYYSAIMSMNEIAERVKKTEEIHKSESLNDMIQRTLTERAKNIKKYLIKQEQRFFNSIVLGVYGGKPEWYELSIRPNKYLDEDRIPKYIEGKLGFILLKGNEKIFAIDGQHRVAGIKEAITDHTEIQYDEINAIFIGHEETEEGLKRTRRLFTTLNRYAKPVNKMELIALDEDNTIAILTRKLFEEYPLFIEKLSTSRTVSLNQKDETNLSLIVTLHDILDIYLKDQMHWNDFKKIRPKDEIIEEYYQRSIQFFNILTNYFPPLKEFYNSKPSEKIALKYRNEEGGNLFFRPIGLKIIVKAIKEVIEKLDWSLEISIQKLKQISLELDKHPWKGLLWDTTNKRMKSGKDLIKVASQLLVFLMDGDITKISPKTTEEKLLNELSGILNIQDLDIVKSRYMNK